MVLKQPEFGTVLIWDATVSGCAGTSACFTNFFAFAMKAPDLHMSKTQAPSLEHRMLNHSTGVLLEHQGFRNMGLVGGRLSRFEKHPIGL